MIKKLFMITFSFLAHINAMERPESREEELLRLSSKNEHAARIAQLIAAGANVNICGASMISMPTTPLYNAVYCGCIDVVRELLKAPDLDINYVVKPKPSLAGQHILHIAIPGIKAGKNSEDRKKILDMLLHDPRILCMIPGAVYEQLPIHDAAARASADVISYLIQKAPHTLNSRDKLGQTPLHHAATYKNGAAIATLLKTPGIDAIITDCYGRTAAQVAAQSGDPAIMNCFVKEASININVTDLQGQTSLHHAARQGSVDEVRTLIQSGADLNSADRRHMTPLHYAVQQDRTAVVELLLNTPGIHIGIPGPEDHMAFQMAFQYGSMQTVNHFLALPGISLTIKDKNNRTLLHLAAANRNSNVPLSFLLGKIPHEVNIPDKLGEAPLSVACTHRIDENVKILLAAPGINAFVAGSNDLPLLAGVLFYQRSSTLVQTLLLAGLTINDQSPKPRGNQIVQMFTSKIQESLRQIFSDRPQILSVILGDLESVKLYFTDRSQHEELTQALEYAIAQRQYSIAHYLGQLLVNKDPVLLNNAVGQVYSLLQRSNRTEHNKVYDQIKATLQALKPAKPLPPLPQHKPLPPIPSIKAKPRQQSFLGQARQSQPMQANVRQESVYFAMPNNEQVARQRSTNALFEAIEHNDISAMKRLLDEGIVEVNYQDEQGTTSLHLAVLSSNHEILPLVLQFKNVDLTIVNEHKQTPLNLAIQKQNERAVHVLLLFGAYYGDVPELFQLVKDPLMVSSIHGDLDAIKKLISASSNLESVKSALLCAIAYQYIPLISYFIMFLINTGNDRFVREALIHVQILLNQTLSPEKIDCYQKIEKLLQSYVRAQPQNYESPQRAVQAEPQSVQSQAGRRAKKGAEGIARAQALVQKWI